MTYPPEKMPPSPDAPEVLRGLGYLPRYDSMGRLMAPGAHYSCCAIYNEPALPAGPCDCGAEQPRPDMGQLPEPEEYEVAEPGNGRVLAVIVAVVVAALIWWGLA